MVGHQRNRSRDAVSQRVTLVPNNPAEAFLSGEEWVAVGSELHLSARELTTAIMIFEGKTRFQIARKLKCAQGTIRVYIDRLFDKLNVRDRLGLGLRIIRVHLAITNREAADTLSHKSATCDDRFLV